MNKNINITNNSKSKLIRTSTLRRPSVKIRDTKHLRLFISKVFISNVIECQLTGNITLEITTDDYPIKVEISNTTKAKEYHDLLIVNKAELLSLTNVKAPKELIGKSIKCGILSTTTGNFIVLPKELDKLISSKMYPSLRIKISKYPKQMETLYLVLEGMFLDKPICLLTVPKIHLNEVDNNIIDLYSFVKKMNVDKAYQLVEKKIHYSFLTTIDDDKMSKRILSILPSKGGKNNE